ncbi:SCO family protein [Vulgatibacter sp.]|uniref:SCO family protein n=1 Tax=Vulgatibacter sp. TaxID=1971226 RepID=UPI0035666B90
MKRLVAITAAWALAALAAAGVASPAAAQQAPGGLMQPSVPKNVLPSDLEAVRVDERLGEMLPLDVVLTDHDGRQVKLGDYFDKGRPVIVNLGYYGCPMLCGLVINGLNKGLKGLDYLPGDEFDIVTVSIDPKEGTALAKQKRESILEELGKDGAGKGWFFHTATEVEIKRLTDAVGFGYRWDEKGKQWAHAAVIMVASPEGKLARYLYGIEYTPKDLKLAVLDAAEGRVGSTTEQLLLFCYQYDAKAGGYVLFARNMMKLGGVVTLVTLGTFLVVMWRRSPRRES